MNKDQPCSWHKCDLTRYYHTIQEWEVHQEYSKVDRPITTTQTVVVEDSQYKEVQAQPIIIENKQGKHDNKWRMIALGTTIAVWAMIIKVVFF